MIHYVAGYVTCNLAYVDDGDHVTDTLKVWSFIDQLSLPGGSIMI
jgi:hypothetical protein